MSWNRCRSSIEEGKVFVNGSICAKPAYVLAAGAQIEIRPEAPRPRTRDRQAHEAGLVVFVDAAVVVVNKPAGMATIPHEGRGPGATEPGEWTLDALVREVLARRDRKRGRAELGVVHRLDRSTTGLMLFARTVAAKEVLAQQFRRHDVHRIYWAIVHGYLTDRTIESHLAVDRGDGIRGSLRGGAKGGQRAVTHVRTLQRLSDATLVECQLETGRTHQIRIHLSEAGHPLVGEEVYIRNFRGRRIDAPRCMLHARELGFVHPVREERMDFLVEPPPDFEMLLESLKSTAPADRNRALRKG